MKRFAVCVFAWSLAACGQDHESRPPPMRAKTPANVYTCSELAGAGFTVQGRAVMVSGSRASCLADDLECPLARLGLGLELCDGGSEAEARCVQGEWLLECLAGEGDGGEADGPSADPADAAPG